MKNVIDNRDLRRIEEGRRPALEDDLEWIRRGRELCERKS